jgi:hypothetical protein
VLVLVPYDKPDGASCRFSFKDTAQQLYLVRLLPARSDVALSRAASVQFLLYKIQVDGYTGWHTVNDASYGFTMALAKGGQSE